MDFSNIPIWLCKPKKTRKTCGFCWSGYIVVSLTEVIMVYRVWKDGTEMLVWVPAAKDSVRSYTGWVTGLGPMHSFERISRPTKSQIREAKENTEEYWGRQG